MPIIGSLAGGSARGLGGLRTFGLLDLNSFDSISTTTVSSPINTIVFSSIPSTYEHLQIRGVLRSDKAADTNADLYLWCNSDLSQANYTRHHIRSNGTSAIAYGFSSPMFPVAGEAPASSSPANVFGATIIDILDYKNTAKKKVVRSFHGDDQGTGTTQSNVFVTSSTWLYTTTISTLTLTLQANTNFVANSKFALYGIKEV